METWIIEFSLLHNVFGIQSISPFTLLHNKKCPMSHYLWSYHLPTKLPLTLTGKDRPLAHSLGFSKFRARVFNLEITAWLHLGYGIVMDSNRLLLMIKVRRRRGNFDSLQRSVIKRKKESAHGHHLVECVMSLRKQLKSRKDVRSRKEIACP